MRLDNAVLRGRVAPTRCSSAATRTTVALSPVRDREADTFPSSREAADRYADDFVCDLGGGQIIRDDELGADDDEDVLG